MCVINGVRAESGFLIFFSSIEELDTSQRLVRDALGYYTTGYKDYSLVPSLLFFCSKALFFFLRPFSFQMFTDRASELEKKALYPFCSKRLCVSRSLFYFAWRQKCLVSSIVTEQLFCFSEKCFVFFLTVSWDFCWHF